MSKYERIIPSAERLVEDNFHPNVQDAIRRVSQDSFPDYPQTKDRLHMTKQEYESWVAEGRPAEKLLGAANNRPSWYVENHPGRTDKEAQEARKKGKLDDYDGTQTFPSGKFGEETDTDSNGAPLHPNTEFIATEGFGVTSLAYNWKLGETRTADAVILYPEDEKLHFVAVTKNELAGKTRCNGLPGETVESTDPNPSAAVTRAVAEEVGVPLDEVKNWKRVPVYDGPTADPRDTLYSWRHPHVEILLPDAEQVEQIKNATTKDTHEIAQALPLLVSKESMNTLTAMDPELLKTGVKKWQEQTGLVIAKDGTIGKADNKA